MAMAVMSPPLETPPASLSQVADPLSLPAVQLHVVDHPDGQGKTVIQLQDVLTTSLAPKLLPRLACRACAGQPQHGS